MKISIVIPTLKTKEQVQGQVNEMNANAKSPDREIICSCIVQSAAKNRNWCMDNAKGDIIIMMDDDMAGFYPGWDLDLVKPLIDSPDKYSIVAARLLNRAGTAPAPQLGDANGFTTNMNEDYNIALHTEQTKLNIVCSACISFIKTDVRFDEKYLGATYEDSDFAMQMNQRYPEKKVIINNRCKLIHRQESKGRTSGNGGARRDNWAHNRDYFGKKWGITI